MRPAVTLVLALLLLAIIGAAVLQFAIGTGPSTSPATSTTITAAS